LRPVDGLLLPAVNEALKALDLADEDIAAARLARRYAATIDGSGDAAFVLERLGPKLLAALESLGATPKARAAMGLKGGLAPVGKLQALRSARGA
jgi:hypothetical protein